MKNPVPAKLALLLYLTTIIAASCRSHSQRAELASLPSAAAAESANATSPQLLTSTNSSSALSAPAAGSGSGQQLTFSHVAYLELAVPTGITVDATPQATLLSSQAGWEQLAGELRIEAKSALGSEDQLPINFADEVLVVLKQTFDQPGQAATITKVFADTSLTVHAARIIPAGVCSQPPREYRVHGVHMIKIKRRTLASLDEAQQERMSAKLQIDETVSACLPTPYSPRHLTQARRRPFTVFFSASTAAQPAAIPRLRGLTGLWGEWDLFLAQQCPSCEAPPLPAGYPGDYMLVTVVDGQAPNQEDGRAQLNVAGVYQIGSDLVIDVERHVQLCSGAPLNQGLMVVKIPRQSLKGNYPPTRLNVRLPYAFMREYQLPCATPGPR